MHLISKVYPTGFPKFTSTGFVQIVFKSIIVLELGVFFFAVLSKFLLVYLMDYFIYIPSYERTFVHVVHFGLRNFVG